MLRVQKGDRGPRVVLLQILLNRQGAALDVDGAFGPKTNKAVVDAQGTARQKQSGIADENLWPILLGDELSIVDAFDVAEERLMTGASVAEKGGSKTVRTGGMCGGVQSVVQQVIQDVGSPGSIALLRMWGHGNLGRWMTFSVGEVVHMAKDNPQEYEAVAAEWQSYVDLDHFDALSPILRMWTPYFAPFGGFEHHGCTLGHVPKTRKLMQLLANLWGVPVTAGTGTQPIPSDPKTTFTFRGQTFTAYPSNGNLASWAKTVAATEMVCR